MSSIENTFCVIPCCSASTCRGYRCASRRAPPAQTPAVTHASSSSTSRNLLLQMCVCVSVSVCVCVCSSSTRFAFPCRSRRACASGWDCQPLTPNPLLFCSILAYRLVSRSLSRSRARSLSRSRARSHSLTQRLGVLQITHYVNREYILSIENTF